MSLPNAAVARINARRARDVGEILLREPRPLQWLSDPFDTGKSEYLVKGLLKPESFIVLYGESGTGKSTLAVDLAFAISTGNLWRGRETRKGLVLHIAGEGARGLRMRQVAYCRRYNVARTAPYAVLPQAVAFDHEAELQLVATVGEASRDIGEAPALVIVDTLSRCLVGDENAGSDMGGFIRCCDYLRAATGAAVMVIHHAGKDTSKGARGHSSLRAAADTELQVIGSGNPRMLYLRKQRDLELVEPMAFFLDPVTLAVEDDGTNVTACVVRHSDRVPTPTKPSGRQQATLLAELERRYEAGEVVWTETELRRIGRAIGMAKSSAISAVVGLRGSQYLLPSVGGATLRLPPGGRQ